MRFGTAAALCGALLASPPLTPPARAQQSADSTLARAEKDFEQALADEKAGAYDRAAQALTEARALAHKETPQLLFHLGLCHAKLGKVVLAREELQRAVSGAKAQGLTNVATTAEAQLAEVQPRIASLALTAPERGKVTAVTVDGVDVGAKLGSGIDLDPGAHVVHVAFEAAPAVDLNVTLGQGERRALPIPEPNTSSSSTATANATPAATAPPAATPNATSPATPSPISDATPSTSSSSHTVGWVLVGSGAALLAGGAVLWILRDGAASTLTNDCGPSQHACPASDQSLIDRGKLEDTLGVTLFAVGGAAAIAGAGLLLFGGSHATATTGLRVTPVLTARGGGVTVSGEVW